MNFFPIIKASGKPRGFDCIAYLILIPKFFPSPSNFLKLEISSFLTIIKMFLIFNNIKIDRE